jgi:hypothetical protein
MRRIAPLALLLIAALAVACLLRARSRRPGVTDLAVSVDFDMANWPPREQEPDEDHPLAAPWTAPGPDGACPVSHPIKAKENSRIFHVPGGRSYERTRADRCYADAGAADADGYRAAKA